MSENIIYSDNNVNITNSRAVLQGTTYPLRNVTSVRLTKHEKEPNSFMGIFVFIALVLFCLFGQAAFNTFDRHGFEFSALESLFSGTSLYVLGGGFSCVVIVLVYFMANDFTPNYFIHISLISGQTEITCVKDIDYAQKIVTHLNNAIASD